MSDAPIDLSSQNVFDILHTTRAMRRLKPDPVADELIVKILMQGYVRRTVVILRLGIFWWSRTKPSRGGAGLVQESF